MAANKFVLRGSGVEVDYTIGGTPGLPALVYKSGAFQRSFTAAQIKTEDTGLGRLISIPFSGPDSIPHRPSTWRSTSLAGTAQSVIVPL